MTTTKAKPATSTDLVAVGENLFAEWAGASYAAKQAHDMADKRAETRDAQVLALHKRGVTSADLAARSNGGKGGGQHLDACHAAVFACFTQAEQVKFRRFADLSTDDRKGMTGKQLDAAKKPYDNVRGRINWHIKALRTALAALEKAVVEGDSPDAATAKKAVKTAGRAMKDPSTKTQELIFQLFRRIYNGGDKPEFVACFGKDGYAKALADIESLNKRAGNPSRPDAAFKPK